jgi:hypothetical protein
MLTSARILALVVAPLAVLGGCTFASPTTSTYNATKPAAVDAGADGSADSPASASPASSGTASNGSSSTTADSSATGGATCCTQSSGLPAGTCITSSAVPPASASYVEQDTCASGNLCVPTSQVTAMPVKCGLIDGLVAGVCIGTCFSQYLSLASVVLTATECGPDDACVPCEALQGRGVAGCDQ